jgi:hypothetical protein
MLMQQPENLLALLVCDLTSCTRTEFYILSVGNAAFHSSMLYANLAESIHPLLSALDDVDEKTRANAAGALGFTFNISCTFVTVST